MTIREYAKAHNHQIVGKLRRIPQYDGRDNDGTKYRSYFDDADNWYTINRNGCHISTCDGYVI